MEKFELVTPIKIHKQEAIEYIKEFYRFSSNINGVGGLDRYLDQYEEWLLKLWEDRHRVMVDDRVSSETFFLIRLNDNKIVGMINIRFALNERLKLYGGHIGYSIRPTERLKGYGQINLYLGLLECQKRGLKEVVLDCVKDNVGSAKVIQSLGGRLVKEGFEEKYAQCVIQKYNIDVDVAIAMNKKLYST